MGKEIERKFLVRHDGWRAEARSETRLRQAYLAVTAHAAVRVRTAGDDRAWITVKSAEPALSRAEYEYRIPVGDAEELMEMRQSGLVEKTRFSLAPERGPWVIDVFAGENDGLVLAEIELSAPDAAFARPDWLGDEVTGDMRFYGARLAVSPYRDWAHLSPAVADG